MSGGSGSGPLVPTFHGFVQNSMDGLMLFEACLSGKLNHVPRRPHDRERASLIKSGSIFIYEENASGIKRWTDGVAWSPSRILGNFLIYRELEKPFPPGEKKRASKPNKRTTQTDGQSSGRRESGGGDASEANIAPTTPSPKPAEQPAESTTADNEREREIDRQLIGSLIDSYGFRSDGLVKKTMSISVNNVSHHLVSYYKVEDVKSKVLKRPAEDPRLAGISVRPDLYLKQNFRTPVEDTEQYMVDPTNSYAHPGVTYGQVMPAGYPMRQGPYMPTPQGYPMYAVSASTPGMYPHVQAHGWPAQQHGHPYSGYPPQAQSQAQVQAAQAYADYYARQAAPLVKTEENGQHGASAYANMANSPYGQPPRSGPGSYPSMQPQPAPLRTSSGAPSPSIPAPQGAQSYGAAGTHSTQYPVPPHTSSYGSHALPAPSSASEQLKSPTATGTPAGAYRQPQYQGQESVNHHEGLNPGYGSGQSQAPQYHGGSYASYGTNGQSYRPPVDGNGGY